MEQQAFIVLISMLSVGAIGGGIALTLHISALLRKHMGTDILEYLMIHGTFKSLYEWLNRHFPNVVTMCEYYKMYLIISFIFVYMLGVDYYFNLHG